MYSQKNKILITDPLININQMKGEKPPKLSVFYWTAFKNTFFYLFC